MAASPKKSATTKYVPTKFSKAFWAEISIPRADSAAHKTCKYVPKALSIDGASEGDTKAQAPAINKFQRKASRTPVGVARRNI